MNTNYDINEIGEQDNNEPDLRETLFIYLKYWKWFVISVIAFLIMGYIYTKLTTPLYKIETDLLIKDNKGSLGGSNDLLKDLDMFSSDKIIDNEIQILKSKTIIEKVVKSLKLETSYYTANGIRKREAYGDLPFEVELLKPSLRQEKKYDNKLSIKLLNFKEAFVNGKTVKVNYPLQTSQGLILITANPNNQINNSQLFDVTFKDAADIVDRYSTNLKIDPVSKQSTVLIITIEDAIPRRGIDFLNGIIKEYNQEAIEDKNKVASNTLSFINERLTGLASTLGSVENDVEKYKSQNKITNIGSSSQILLQSVDGNDIQLNKVSIQLNVLQNLQNYLNLNNNQGAALPSMLGIEDPTLLGLVSQLGELQLRRLSFLQTVPETNPLVSSLADQISSVKQSINSSVQNLTKGLLITKQQLQQKNNQFESTIKQVPTQERGLLDVMRQQNLQDTLFMYLLQKREQTRMQLASGVADSRIIDVARSSKEPVKPVKQIIYLLFFALGVLVPAIIIYLKNLLNFRVVRRADVERNTDIPIIAEISHTNEPGSLLVLSKPRSMVAEQIRALRTNLQFVLPKEDQKVILFTSSISGEGKSFVSLNLGASLAMSDKKVIILELDLRKPKLHMGLNLDNELGISNYLIGKVNINQIIKDIPIQKNYSIITSGPIPPNPAELLVNGQISKLIEELKREYDYIILDAPPVGLVTDAQILGVYADATLFIVRHNYTAKAQINSLDGYFKSKKFNNINIIMNSINIDQTHGYGYSYGYGYGGYYTEEIKKSKKMFSWFKK